MLHEQISDTQFHFVDFDAQDVILLQSEHPTWIRIDRSSVETFPTIYPAGPCHILIQKDRAIQNIGSLSKCTSIELYSCPHVDMSTLTGDTIRQLKLRNMPTDDLPAIGRLTKLESLWFVRMKVGDFSFLNELCALRLVWITPIRKADLEQVSKRKREVIFSNGDAAYQDGLEVHPHTFEDLYADMDVSTIATHP